MAALPSPWRLRLAVRQLRRGGILAYPTEAVYGLGCDPFNGVAVARLLQLKGRSPSKGLILLAADFAQIAPYVRVPAEMSERVHASWPGPVTWVLPASAALPHWLCVDGTVAARVTAHALAAALCRAFGGPVVSTSANPSGRRPARTPLTVRRYFRGSSLSIVHGPTGGAARPSAIYHGITGQRLR